MIKLKIKFKKNMHDKTDKLADLWLAQELILRNKDLIIKYPSLEDSLNLLTKVIMMEQEEES